MCQVSESSTAIVLVSGGLDSATVLAMALADGFECHAMSFAYGQRHKSELAAARALASASCISHQVVNIDLTVFGASALTDSDIAVPEAPTVGIPVTYVPARNTIFLSYALAKAEVLPASRIYIGVNAIDYSGYPDCRPAFINAFQNLADLATRAGVEGEGVTIEAPLQHLSKSEIIGVGTALGVDYSQTVSCYQADDEGRACGVCDSCRLRREGFVLAGLVDPTRYR